MNWRRNRRLRCDCRGYWFPHRIGSGSCEQRADKLAAYLCKVRREGGDVDEARFDWIVDHGTPADPDDIPF